MLPVDPYSIEFDKIPFLSLKDKRHLPAIACVYWVATKDRYFEYIGATSNLKRRFTSHSRAKDFVEDCYIQWIAVESKQDREELECAMIYAYRPRINVVGIKRSHPSDGILRHAVLIDADSDLNSSNTEYYLYGY